MYSATPDLDMIHFSVTRLYALGTHGVSSPRKVVHGQLKLRGSTTTFHCTSHSLSFQLRLTTFLSGLRLTQLRSLTPCRFGVMSESRLAESVIISESPFRSMTVSGYASATLTCEQMPHRLPPHNNGGKCAHERRTSGDACVHPKLPSLYRRLFVTRSQCRNIDTKNHQCLEYRMRPSV